MWWFINILFILYVIGIVLLLTFCVVNVVFVISKKKANKTLPPNEQKSISGNVTTAITCGVFAVGYAILFGLPFYVMYMIQHGKV